MRNRASPVPGSRVAPLRRPAAAAEPDLAVVADEALVAKVSVECVVRADRRGHVPQSAVDLSTRDTLGVHPEVSDGLRAALIVGTCVVVQDELPARLRGRRCRLRPGCPMWQSSARIWVGGRGCPGGSDAVIAPATRKIVAYMAD